MKKPVDDEDTFFFIQFIFDRLAANRNFDKNINIMGWVEASWNRVKKHDLLLQCLLESIELAFVLCGPEGHDCAE
jgi:hypothetical protein